MLPLAALASGEALWTAGAERGARERAGAARSLAAARKRCSGAAAGEACSHAIDASDGLPEAPPRTNIRFGFLVSYAAS